MTYPPDETAEDEDCTVPPALEKTELHTLVLGMNEHQAKATAKKKGTNSEPFRDYNIIKERSLIDPRKSLAAFMTLGGNSRVPQGGR